ncbi:MAG TPA: hypothetical protein DCO77_07415 [Nitrospiraceae bacterium]|nr:hypothetical protein [Nitrospiraceae bacterium]
MSKVTNYFLVLSFLACFSPPIPALAEEQNENGKWSFAIEEWFSRADAGWQISFSNSGSSGPGKVESELTFERINSPITILKGSRPLGSDWSLEAALGIGNINSGQGTDTDRFFPLSGGVDVFSQSKQDLSGDVLLLEINAYRRRNRTSNPWGLIVGFLHYEDRLRMRNGVQTISGTFNGDSFPLVGTVLTGLDSTYDFYWTALKIGTLYEWNTLKRLSLNGSLSLYPVTVYYGEGFWNLRAGTSFRTAAPSFTHLSLGFGFEAKLGLTFLITKRVNFGAGYRYLHLKAKDGTYTVYPSNGPKATADLDWAEVTRHGAYARFLFQF